MSEFILLPTKAMEDNGFKLCIARNETLGTAETLEQARRMALDLAGASIFRNRQPVGLPDVAGGHQPFGNLLQELKDLKWLCLVDVIIPGTIGTERLRTILDQPEEVEDLEVAA